MLRNSVAYAVTLQRGVCIKNVRGGRPDFSGQKQNKSRSSSGRLKLRSTIEHVQCSMMALAAIDRLVSLIYGLSMSLSS